VIAQLKGADIAHVSLWVGAAFGNYGASKLTEIANDKGQP